MNNTKQTKNEKETKMREIDEMVKEANQKETVSAVQDAMHKAVWGTANMFSDIEHILRAQTDTIENIRKVMLDESKTLEEKKEWVMTAIFSYDLSMKSFSK